jgi:hypothetical protein
MAKYIIESTLCMGSQRSLDGDIIDEPRRGEPCRGEQPDRYVAARGDRRQSFRVARFEIIHDETSRRESGAGAIESGFDGYSPFDVVGAPAKRRMKGRCNGSLFCRQKDIARRQSQAIGLAHGGHAQNFRLEIEIARHSCHDFKLLVVLFAKRRDIRAALVEEFCHDGCDACKMRWPETILQSHGRGPRQGDGSGKTLGVHGLAAWREQQIAARRRELSRIGLERAGIGVEIFRRRELRRIYENRHHHTGRAFFRFVYKRNMSGMKRAHGRHKPDRLARAPPLREPGPEARHVTHDLNTACGGGGHDWSL